MPLGSATWLNPTPGQAQHVYDMATLTGSDLWFVGSDYLGGATHAGAWRSLDQGATWTEVLSQPPLDDNGSNFSRFYGVVAYQGKLYVEPYDQSSRSPTALEGLRSDHQQLVGRATAGNPDQGRGLR